MEDQTTDKGRKTPTKTVARKPLTAGGSLQGGAGLLSNWINKLTTSKVVVIICLFSFLAYANSLGGEFVFDDVDQIVNNPTIRNWINVIDAFKTHVWQFRQGPHFLRVPVPPPYYRPVFTILFTVEYHLFGLWPQGWHLVSLAFHILCAILVFYLVSILFQRKDVAVIAAVVFAVFPLHAESVSWISGVTDPLYALPFLGSFYLYLRFRQSGQRKFLVFSLIASLISLFSKETAVSIIALVFVYEFIELRLAGTWLPGAVWTGLLRCLPYFGPVILYLIPRYIVLGGFTWDSPFTHKGPFTDTLITLPLILWTYVGHMLWPVNLTLAYQTHFVTNAGSWEFLLPGAGLFLVVVLLFAFRARISREVWLSLALIIAPLLPVLDLGQLGEEYLVFDRYLYVSVMGFGCLLAMAILKLDTAKWRSLVTHAPLLAQSVSIALLVVLLGLLTAGTARENRPWRDAYSLWSNAARARPLFWAARYNKGLALAKQKRYQEALMEFEAAWRLNPSEPAILDSAGRVYESMGDLATAALTFEEAVTMYPEFFESLNNLGTIYFKMGKYPLAETYFKRAIKLKPIAAQSHYNLGLCYEREGRNDEAAKEFEGVIKETPNDAETYYELGLVYQKLGQRQQAVEVLQRGLGLAKSDELRNRINQAISTPSSTPN